MENKVPVIKPMRNLLFSVIGSPTTSSIEKKSTKAITTDNETMTATFTTFDVLLFIIIFFN